MTFLRSRLGQPSLLGLALLAALWLALAGQAAQAQTQGAAQAAPRKVALIIGNSNYVNLGMLPNPGNDARLVADAARSAGFQTVTVVQDLGLPAFRKALIDFQAQADNADVALVYYAGHGIEQEGINYLIPTDVTLADPSELMVEAIQLDYVLGKLRGAKRYVVLLDACRDNPLKDKWTARGVVITSTGLARFDARGNSLVILAAEAGKQADDGQGVNSAFAVALKKFLPQPGLALKDLGGMVQGEVQTATKYQKPEVINNLGADTFALVPVIKVDIPEDPAQREYAAWGKADKEGTALSYNEYLRQFPTGQFAEQAKISIRTLCRNNPNCMDGPASPPIVVAVPAQVVVAPEPQQVPVQTQSTSEQGQPVQAQAQTASVQAPPKPVTPQPVMPQPVTPQPDLPPLAVDTCASGSATCYNLPQIPPAPVFARGNYPACKDDWKSVKDPVQAVASVNTCLTAYFSYKSSTLDKFLSDLAAYQEVVNGLNLQVQGTGKPYKVEAQKQFFNEAQRLFREQQPGGSLRKLHEATSTEWERDVVTLKDSYNRATGCGGYPTPSGLAKTTYCPYN